MSTTSQQLGKEPAFPKPALNVIDSEQIGLTKREWLAGMAMQGLIASTDQNDLEATAGEVIAQGAVAYADALLAELANGGAA